MMAARKGLRILTSTCYFVPYSCCHFCMCKLAVQANRSCHRVFEAWTIWSTLNREVKVRRLLYPFVETCPVHLIHPNYVEAVCSDHPLCSAQCSGTKSSCNVSTLVKGIGTNMQHAWLLMWEDNQHEHEGNTQKGSGNHCATRGAKLLYLAPGSYTCATVDH